MKVAPNAPLFPLIAEAAPDGRQVIVRYGYWDGETPVVRFGYAFEPGFTDAQVTEALAAFQALADRVDTLTDGWRPRILAGVTLGKFGNH